ncbi:MAG: peptide-methionine (R)-S-oxide reductase MsrB [Bacillota bacterium]|nr:peptide-methionine (R)-S-oxide reductase MsrB [Bacillota bacterium]
MPGEFEVHKEESQWRRDLSPLAYRVLRRRATEPPFVNEHCRRRDAGVYRCAGCGEPLFDSDAKFDSGHGWPSFHSPTTEQCIVTRSDRELGTERTEVLCARCGGHLGHVFRDGPKPTGLRY